MIQDTNLVLKGLKILADPAIGTPGIGCAVSNPPPGIGCAVSKPPPGIGWRGAAAVARWCLRRADHRSTRITRHIYPPGQGGAPRGDASMWAAARSRCRVAGPRPAVRSAPQRALVRLDAPLHVRVVRKGGWGIDSHATTTRSHVLRVFPCFHQGEHNRSAARIRPPRLRVHRSARERY